MFINRKYKLFNLTVLFCVFCFFCFTFYYFGVGVYFPVVLLFIIFFIDWESLYNSNEEYTDCYGDTYDSNYIEITFLFLSCFSWVVIGYGKGLLSLDVIFFFTGSIFFGVASFLSIVISKYNVHSEEVNFTKSLIMLISIVFLVAYLVWFFINYKGWVTFSCIITTPYSILF
jgi:hypothetical protein